MEYSPLSTDEGLAPKTLNFGQKYLKSTQFFIIILFVCVFLIFILSKVNFSSFGPAYINQYLIFSQEPSQNSSLNESTCEPFHINFKSYQVNINDSIYPKSVPLFLNRSLNFECLQKTTKIKKILFWTPFFGDWSYSYGLGVETPFEKQNCPVTKCELTNDKNKLSSADLVIVHMRDSIDEPPKERPLNQRWVFTLYESPPHSPNFEKYHRFFNLTSTYRIDSDFSHFYETDNRIEWKLNKNFDDNYDFYSDKSEFAAAVISNCGGSSKRLKYIQELQKYVSVNVFGKCGKKCPSTFKNSSRGDCKQIIGKEYKFYFAFENSVCKDYITEKFFVILQQDIIPVVLGGGLYEHYIPKSAFINVKDFSSPKDLADYLIYLDKNKTAYNSYFKWKKHITFLDKVPGFSPICSMCIQLHMERFTGVKRQIIENIHDYWHKDVCKIPEFSSDGKFDL